MRRSSNSLFDKPAANDRERPGRPHVEDASQAGENRVCAVCSLSPQAFRVSAPGRRPRLPARQRSATPCPRQSPLTPRRATAIKSGAPLRGLRVAVFEPNGDLKLLKEMEGLTPVKVTTCDGFVREATQ